MLTCGKTYVETDKLTYYQSNNYVKIFTPENCFMLWRVQKIVDKNEFCILYLNEFFDNKTNFMFENRIREVIRRLVEDKLLNRSVLENNYLLMTVHDFNLLFSLAKKLIKPKTVIRRCFNIKNNIQNVDYYMTFGHHK
jgi:hypothetical protein